MYCIWFILTSVDGIQIICSHVKHQLKQLDLYIQRPHSYIDVLIRFIIGV